METTVQTITIQDQKLSYMGDASMLLCPLTTFLCSHRPPLGVTSIIRQWVDTLNIADTCVVCGNLTAEERYAMHLLVERGIPVVLALARAIPASIQALQLTPDEQNAYTAGRLVVISPVTDATITDATGKTSAARNKLMIRMAEQIVVGYMAENGNLASQLLGQKNVTHLSIDGLNIVSETDEQKLQYNQTQMGWSIYRRLKDDSLPITSVEVRQLLAQYLKLPAIPRPSLLHSLLLFQVVKYYAHLGDFDFTTFFRMWGPEHLRPEDWKTARVDDKWLPSLAERVLARLFKALPDKFHVPVNPSEQFDPRLAHQLLDVFLARPRVNQRMLKRALSLAFFEHDQEAITRYKALLNK